MENKTARVLVHPGPLGLDGAVGASAGRVPGVASQHGHLAELRNVVLHADTCDEVAVGAEGEQHQGHGRGLMVDRTWMSLQVQHPHTCANDKEHVINAQVLFITMDTGTVPVWQQGIDLGGLAAPLLFSLQRSNAALCAPPQLQRIDWRR